jgi:hypothetical protein
VVISCYRTANGINITDRIFAGQLARFEIPESAPNFRGYTEKFLDQMICGRFDIPADDLKQKLSQMPADGKHGEYDGHSHVTIHEMKLEWWQPELLQNRKIIKWALPNFEVNLLYGDNGTAESITVYFFSFSS